jgi:hypothetical protein
LIVSKRARFFRTRPDRLVVALLVLAVVAEVVGFGLHGTPVHLVHVKHGPSLPDQPTHAVDYLKFALKLGGVLLVIAAALLHGDRLNTPEDLEADAGRAQDLEEVNRRTVTSPISQMPPRY